MKKFSQVLSVAISAAIAVTSAPWQAYALEAGAMPEFVKTFTPPTRLGYVVDSFKGTSAQPIVLIQDLHANFGVQQKIVSLLKVFEKNAVASNEMIIGSEGNSGPIDVSYLHGQSPKVRQLASTALLKEAEIGAPMHFAINADKNVNLVGIEDMDDYKLHLSLIRASVQARLKLANKIQETREKFAVVKAKMAPESLNKIWKAEDEYINGDIDLDRLARVLHLPAINSYDEVEQALLSRKLELARASKTNAVFLENLVRADHYLSLFGRLFRQQMTLEEVQFTAQHMDEAISVLMGVLPNENWTEWKETIHTAIDYYAIALMRDKPLAENAMKLVDQHPDQPVFIVTGGFHTAGIEKMLAARNISYVSIAPVVESHTMKDEVLYLNRILDIRANVSAIKTDVQTKPWVNFVLPTMTPNASGLEIKAAEEAGKTLSQPVNSPAPENAAPANPAQPKPGDSDPIATPDNVGDLPSPTVGPEAEQAILDQISQALLAAHGYTPGAAAVATVEYGVTTSESGKEQWAMTTSRRDGKYVTVVNRRFVTLLGEIRANLAKDKKLTESEIEARIQSVILSYAVNEQSVVATQAINERTAMAGRLGLLSLMGEAAQTAFDDVAAVLGADSTAAQISAGIAEFMHLARADEPNTNYSTVTRIANGIVDHIANRFKGNDAFNEAINDKAVRALFNGALAANAGIAAHNLAAEIQSGVSLALSRIGPTPAQNKALTAEEIQKIYGRNA